VRGPAEALHLFFGFPQRRQDAVGDHAPDRGRGRLQHARRFAGCAAGGELVEGCPWPDPTGPQLGAGGGQRVFGDRSDVVQEPDDLADHLGGDGRVGGARAGELLPELAQVRQPLGGLPHVVDVADLASHGAGTGGVGAAKKLQQFGVLQLVQVDRFAAALVGVGRADGDVGRSDLGVGADRREQVAQG